MSTSFTSRLLKLSRPAVLLAAVATLSACGITKMGDIPEYLDSPFKEEGPREYITTADLQKVRLGMSYLEVKNRLGPPMLNDIDEKDRWDYVLRKGSGADEEFMSYGVYFKDDKVIRVAALEQPPESIVGQGLPEPAPEPVLAEPEVIEPEVNDAALISDMLNGWVAAWAGKDVESYLGYYSSDFKPNKGSRSAWESQRNKRLSNKDYISVSLSNVQIDLQTDSMAEVMFDQEYSSNNYSDKGSKVLTLVKENDQWLIQKETFSK